MIDRHELNALLRAKPIGSADEMLARWQALVDARAELEAKAAECGDAAKLLEALMEPKEPLAAMPATVWQRRFHGDCS